jgi:hypothetical protein
VPSDEHPLTVGPDRPILLNDHYLFEQMANVNRERIPEREPHAKGFGAEKWTMKKRVTAALAFAAFAIGAATAACSSAQKPIEAPTKPDAQQQVPVPDAVKVPDGSKLAGSFEGTGVQIYQCTGNTWALLQPAAIMSDNGRPIALHSKGPVWISTFDGSSVGAAPVPNAAVTHDDAVPELLLKATENHGAGLFSSVTYVQRLATKGGLAPKGVCTDGAEQSVKYSATYTFYTARG